MGVNLVIPSRELCYMSDSTTTEKTFTREEVEKHNSKGDLWLIFEGKVYDMTPFFPSHPGAGAMMKQAGKDATMAIYTVPSHNTAWNFVKNKLSECYIGKLK